MQNPGRNLARSGPAEKSSAPLEIRYTFPAGESFVLLFPDDLLDPYVSMALAWLAILNGTPSVSNPPRIGIKSYFPTDGVL